MTGNILIIEDETAIQELIVYNLKKAGFKTSCATSAEQAIIAIHNNLPDLILLDWMLPKMTGIELLCDLRQNEQTKLIPVIMLTARTEEDDKIKGLDVGADDYVTKPFSPRELIARMNAILRGRSPKYPDNTIEINKLRLIPSNQRVMVNQHEVILGPIEYRLLHFMMTHTDRAYTRNQLLKHVWSEQTSVDERTVDVHIRRLRKALQPVSKDHLIQTARGIGYFFATDNRS